ncbi:MULTISPECIES: response regulator transcription factor [Pseudoxanthomonas]|jgi:DNA-binding response OmpR family regulator|uniref:Response regulator transcription factor n=1 Tax=Pseudoxanthomonas winnipegensis TaxID=2480810 RepID=A0A4Q8LBE6_9GAMM|nr:response regulator transcription factor [Pseudoxanthomonas winnipegensis]RZZ83121.1 response regulator transcription factor [Pseudoxanthomonas winnipegensis]RZZ83976.1 response regulator transcription factor [Pseudoxanthomonas winnipegensis]TAA07445.1 response regulator transcription factor [Pseudoxanthomonas winnipegensis]TAA17474.1 response regulator transcription factor [Pseudoxanthomonas winnipegensis]TAA26096.1 response regulator transcription factor [Pseudoxanthomonas winnipegensis]
MRAFQQRHTLLLVDDDYAIATATGEYLESIGYDVDYAHDGLEGLRLASEQHYDVILLDGKMPRMDGLDVCRAFRREVKRSTPIIFLSGRERVEDRVTGIEAGADDYLVKPYALPELQARLNALIKRQRRQLAGTRLTVGDLTLETENYTVKRAGQRLSLSPIQFQLLAVLMRHSPAIVTRAQLEREIWGSDLPDSDTLRSHIYNLRKVIDKPFDSPLLHTHLTFGFRLAPVDQPLPSTQPETDSAAVAA